MWKPCLGLTWFSDELFFDLKCACLCQEIKHCSNYLHILILHSLYSHEASIFFLWMSRFFPWYIFMLLLFHVPLNHTFYTWICWHLCWKFHLCSGTYIDKKCPFTGTVSVRGRILAGTCHSAKMMRTIIVRRNYLHYIKKYQRQDVFVL